MTKEIVHEEYWFVPHPRSDEVWKLDLEGFRELKDSINAITIPMRKRGTGAKALRKKSRKEQVQEIVDAAPVLTLHAEVTDTAPAVLAPEPETQEKAPPEPPEGEDEAPAATEPEAAEGSSVTDLDHGFAQAVAEDEEDIPAVDVNAWLEGVSTKEIKAWTTHLKDKGIDNWQEHFEKHILMGYDVATAQSRDGFKVKVEA